MQPDTSLLPRSLLPTSLLPTSLLIEGWRGVSHSFALTSQYYILELLKIDGLRLFHHDLPFFNKEWSRANNNANFSPEAQQRIDALPPAGDNLIDCVYRICSPIMAGADDDRRRTLTYMVTEVGLAAGSLTVAPDRYSFFTRDDNLIVTPTRWSRERVIEFGFPADQVKIIPSGVDTAIYRPLSAAERAANRANLGIRDDETVFVNVGAGFWNKGVDVLLRAFAKLHGDGRKVRLIIKDQRGLYGVSLEQTIQDVGKQCPRLLHPDTLGAISVISGNLNQTQLRALYSIADCYVSPYRAEGFNLPVLEAIACGTPVIVTAGGSTDDFCPDGVAWRIPGRPDARGDLMPGFVARYIEPDLEALIGAMEGVSVGWSLDEAGHPEARAQVLEAFSWQRAARRLAGLASGQAEAETPVVQSAANCAGWRDDPLLQELTTGRLAPPNVLRSTSRLYVAYRPDSDVEYDTHPELRALSEKWIRNNVFNNAGDLPRLYAVSLNVKQVLTEGVLGDFAELGVYRGNSAAVLAHYARQHNRLVFLFDTFDGFDAGDLTGIDASVSREFHDTSLDLVRENVGDGSVVYVKGHFPGSITDEAAARRFAIVHLDCDLYEPMRAALEFFYPRLSPGGLMILHDYSSVCWVGVKQAIDEYLPKITDSLILIPDKSGTAMIRKTRPIGN
jgi:glycosyltransferase involved in cell wall biosynthesis